MKPTPIALRVSRLRLGDVVQAWWLDSAAMHGWRESAHATSGSLRVVTVGVVVCASADELVVSSSYGDNRDVMDPLTIPTCAIQGFRRLGKIDTADLRKPIA
jgi:hypothetical protein